MGQHCYQLFIQPFFPFANLTLIEEIIYNEGERLIPGVTHDLAELIRHRSSYMFFGEVMKRDFAIINKDSKSIQIADLGCGVGHGCQTISDILNSHVIGIDSFLESLEYARTHYAGKNITYKCENLEEFIPAMNEYDYLVSRGVFEHIPNGLNLARSTKWRYRLFFDVPYDEPENVNSHHLLAGIREESFLEFDEAELFFQDMSGVIYDISRKPPNPNMVICVCSHPDLPKVGASRIRFPFPAWKPQPHPFQKDLNWSQVSNRIYRTFRKIVGVIRLLTK